MTMFQWKKNIIVYKKTATQLLVSTSDVFLSKEHVFKLILSSVNTPNKFLKFW